MPEDGKIAVEFDFVEENARNNTTGLSLEQEKALMDTSKVIVNVEFRGDKLKDFGEKRFTEEQIVFKDEIIITGIREFRFDDGTSQKPLIKKWSVPLQLDFIRSVNDDSAEILAHRLFKIRRR